MPCVVLRKRRHNYLPVILHSIPGIIGFDSIQYMIKNFHRAEKTLRKKTLFQNVLHKTSYHSLPQWPNYFAFVGIWHSDT